MDTLGVGQNRRLLFRTYAIVVGGLVLVAAAIDFGFSRVQQDEPSTALAWADGSIALIEARLIGVPESEWAAETARLGAELGYPVKILPFDDFVQRGQVAAGTQEVFDAAGRAAYFKRSSALDAALQIGPLPTDPGDGSPWLMLVPTLFYVSIAVVVSLWLWPLLRDLNLLTAAARAFAADYRRPMTTSDKTTTLRELATSFDDMAARIRGLIQSQKDLTSALSHEVRTPLARIKFAMAVMSDRANVAAELESIDQDVQEIDRLVATMLDYARLDHPNAAVSWQLTPIEPWLERIVKKTAIGNGTECRLRVATAASAELVRMDPYLMELALSNLLVNASRYAASAIEVGFESTRVDYTLTVADDGPGVPESERENIFKPFKRLDDSRNRETGGYGLGLAIVARIAARHGGRAHAEAAELGGARMVVSWPKT